MGRTISIGHDLCLRVTDPAPRCVVPTLPQDQLASEIGILRAIANHNRPAVPALADAQLPCLGVYAVVEQGGTIVVGETVRITMPVNTEDLQPLNLLVQGGRLSAIFESQSAKSFATSLSNY